MLSSSVPDQHYAHKESLGQNIVFPEANVASIGSVYDTCISNTRREDLQKKWEAQHGCL